MRVKKFVKRIPRVNPPSWGVKTVEEKTVETPKKNNAKNKKEEDMTTEQIEKAEALAQDVNAQSKNVKIIKKEKGLIERTESQKVILEEDNRQLLND